MKTNTGSKNQGGNNSASKKSSAGAEGNTELTKYFHDLLKDTYNAEKQLTKALPKLAKAATSEELKACFKDHLAVTEGQVTRLEQVFESAGLKVASKKCEAMEGLVKEGQEAIEDTEDGSLVRDVALIVAAQKAEHYEIAAYGSLRDIAKILGFTEAAGLLQETLDEESDADQILSGIASEINAEAYGEDSDEGGDEGDESDSSSQSQKGQKKDSSNSRPGSASKK